ncbi:MAG: azurin [Planctomycetes bacterium]|nr:azurin [Planctomycetota bacterium]
MTQRRNLLTWSCLIALGLGLVSNFAAAADLQINKGDHICIIGNTLADRMQKDGWVETMLQARFAGDDLVIRNLGFSADTVALDGRLRSMNFGSPDEWLAGKGNPIGGYQENRFAKTNTNADVIFAFFGYNESFAGEKGLDQFKKDLNDFIDHTLAQKYNGKSAPRLVLFSPIAHEDLHNPNLPDGKENNQNLKLYTEAMAQVAKAKNIPFVDLYTPTLAAYAAAKSPLTINGVHLNEDGNKVLAQIIDKSLFGAAVEPKNGASLTQINEAVKDKNFYWYRRYRMVDGYSTFGARAFLVFSKAAVRQVKSAKDVKKEDLLPMNYDTMQRELEVLDVMTSNRDQRIWAVAMGKDRQVDDSNTPPFVETDTNEPGKGPNGAHEFLSGEEAIKHMKLGKGIKVGLFASEEQFPELINPVQMSFDTQGRLWVASWKNYPHWQPKTPMDDKLLVLEDTNHDGKADKVTAFVDNLEDPTGFEFWNGGVIVAQAPDIVFYKDTDGDGKADQRTVLLSGMDTADTHHTSNSFVMDPGGAFYWQEGTFHHTQVETPWGAAVRNINAGVYRFEPRTAKFEVYVPYNFANPHGHVFDYWGYDIVHDGTGAVPYMGASFSGHTDYPAKHKGGAPVLYKQRTRPCPGTEILSSPAFPKDMQGDLLVGNVIGMQGILHYKISEDGSGLSATEQEPILSSDDYNFRPVDFEMGPDGALYFCDWQNPIIGHMQHNLRDPSRDQKHGRIYKVTYEGMPLVTPAPIAGEPIDKLLDLLKSETDRVRYRTRIELTGRNVDDVMAALNKWVAGLDKSEPTYEHNLLEALWLHQSFNVVDEALLKQVLAAKDFHARAAATRVLCYWRDRVKDPLKLLAVQSKDENPRVRLEAIRALSFFTDSKDQADAAIEIALEAADKPLDKYLKYTLDETTKTLDSVKK